MLKDIKIKNYQEKRGSKQLSRFFFYEIASWMLNESKKKLNSWNSKWR